MPFLCRAAALFAMTVASLSISAAARDCSDIQSDKNPAAMLKKTIKAQDLIELRDFGSPDNGSGTDSPFSVSPDGRFAALQIRRARTASNDYCIALVVITLSGSRPAEYLDIGGDWIPEVYDYEGLALAQVGLPQPVVPQWSPDSKSIAYLRRDHGVTQIWRAGIGGDRAHQITFGKIDVLSFRWAADGKSFIFSQNDGLAPALSTREDEGKRGYVYGDRFLPTDDSKPFIPAPIARGYYRVSSDGMTIVDATDGDRQLLSASQAVKTGAPDTAYISVASQDHDVAWLAPVNSVFILSPMVLHVKLKDGRELACDYPECRSRLLNIWWTQDGKDVIFLRREGPAESRLGLYQWRPGGGAPKSILHTDDLLIGCQNWHAALLCAHEASTQPRRLISIEINTGRMLPIFDPNPQFSLIQLGKVERLVWKNAAGVETFGDLVLPANHKPGQQHPLIIVQYESRGFLRGGTGDEFPIQMFADRGYAVLSFNRPKELAYDRSFTTYADFERYNVTNWADKRNVLSSLLSGIDLVARRNLVDARHIGITGFSDGSSGTRFALINSNRFSAAALGTNCGDYVSALTLVGPKSANHSGRYQYPPLSEPDWDRTKPMSLIMNAKKITAPILMQLADHEYICAIESYTALREQRRPTEMYVFPDEYHVKWQPAHRLAIYERSLDWFDFWLLGKEHNNPIRAAEYARWRDLRRQMPAAPLPAAEGESVPRSDQ